MAGVELHLAAPLYLKNKELYHWGIILSFAVERKAGHHTGETTPFKLPMKPN